jgi:hypothetical protein
MELVGDGFDTDRLLSMKEAPEAGLELGLLLLVKAHF